MPGFATALRPAPVMLASVGDVLDFLPLLLIVVANLAALRRGPKEWPNWYWLVLAAVGCGVLLLGVASIPGGLGYGLGYMIGGAAMAVLALAPVRRLAARVLPIEADSPLDVTALGLTLVIACSQIGLQLSTNVLARLASSPPETPLDQLLTELPFLLAALLGVGLLMRRGLRSTLGRLGLTRPRWWEIALGLACAGAFYALGIGAEAVQQWLTPALAARVGSATSQLYRGVDTPVGILTIALVPAICEETLFRGALQPRLGLIWTAIVFALLHTQYGISIDELAVVILAFGLGILRRFTNTATSMLCHAVYNALTAAGLAVVLPGPALAAEAVLVIGLVVWAIIARRKITGPAA
ncbi:MAG: lysostaphin resistance A-like protein [Candidatus Dormibacteraceae bacterium]